MGEMVETLLGGLLVGGASRRMGEPKALADTGGGRPMAEAVADALRPHVEELVLLGDGPVPASLAHLHRLEDAPLPAPGAARSSSPHTHPEAGSRPRSGPLAGILAALRHRPDAAWLICPCDLPRVEPAAVAWLLGERRAGRAAVLPRPGPAGPPQPLFALYEPAALALVEALAAAGERAPVRLADRPGVATPAVPSHLTRCWADADTPRDLARLRDGG